MEDVTLVSDDGSTLEASDPVVVRGPGRWLPVVVLVLAVGLLVAAAVWTMSALDAKGEAEAAAREARAALVEAEHELEQERAASDEAVRPATRFFALARDAQDGADEATRLDGEEMALNRSSVQLGIVGDVPGYNRVIDEVNAERVKQYRAALDVYQLLNQLRALDL
jgi:hypothetical protein